ncbi:YpjP family protein [Alkalihalobacillus sp. TS-13]|uniref:YpjP family protein n=1 Tax=Alkalihalobacillus sp. TS-13 TaxID=2842455 RepID=UPI001C88D24B|nr:YpjP family protein [Alkalihalobacillus sp. TS-13]
MPVWLRKTLVVLITVFTLGTVSPPPHLLADSDKSTSTESAENYIETKNITSPQIEKDPEPDFHTMPWKEIAATYEDTEDLQDAFVTYTVIQATEQTRQKFGERIESKRGEEFRSVILPKIEETITYLSSELDEEIMRNLMISDRPTKGKGEKIFHIKNASTGLDIFRLHVRRENPPGKGHWFSFHYHDARDHFASHHELGSIYWDRNTPPNWMS